MISAILLCAGESSRFGSPKALAQIHGDCVINYILKKLISSLLNEIIVVLGAHAQEINLCLLQHKKINIVYNNHYNFGQTFSFQCGIQASTPDSHGFMLFPVDMPLIKVETVDLLIRHFLLNQPSILIPTFNGRKGHPPIFHNNLYNKILGWPAQQGLNTLIQHSMDENESVFPVDDPGILENFNTMEEFETIKNRFSNERKSG